MEEISKILRKQPNQSASCSKLAQQLYETGFQPRKNMRFLSYLKQYPNDLLIKYEGSDPTITLLSPKSPATVRRKISQKKFVNKAQKNTPIPKKPVIKEIKFKNLFEGEIIDTEDKLESFSLLWERQSTPEFVILACEGINLSKKGELCILQVAWDDKLAIFDIYMLREKAINLLKNTGIFSDGVLKFVHDAGMSYCALREQYGVVLKGVIDTQLWFEKMTGKMQAGLTELLRFVKLNHETKALGNREIERKPESWKSRPLYQNLLRYAQDDARLLNVAVQKLGWVSSMIEASDLTGKVVNLSKLLLASQERLEYTYNFGKSLRVVVDAESLQFKSYELARAFSVEQIEIRSPVICNDDVVYLINSLPEQLRPQLLNHDMLNHLREIVLDEGQKPYAVFTHTSPPMEIDLHDDIVTDALLEEISQSLKFGDDNRAALEGKLHRISRKMAREKMDGLTIRVGRGIENCESLLGDLLQDENRSILFLGVPGSGKTSVIRSTAARIRKQGWSVMIVDTSNEIGGDGRLHSMLGRCRRMMVPNINKQSDVMVEAVQNHTPQTMVIDEIGRAQEVKAAQTVKTRGVRMIASAHGTFSSLLSNPALRGLLGGFQTVIVPGYAKKKSRTERCGNPVFDTIVEVVGHGEFRIIRDVASAVDLALEGNHITMEKRSASNIEAKNGILPCLNLSFA